MGTRLKPKTRARTTEAPPHEPFIPHGAAVLLDRWAVCKALGVGLRKFKGMLAAGEYPTADVKLGSLNRWTVEAHNAAVSALKERGSDRAGRGQEG